MWAISEFEGHEVVVEILLKGGATLDMQNKVCFYYSCSLPHTSTQCI